MIRMLFTKVLCRDKWPKLIFHVGLQWPTKQSQKHVLGEKYSLVMETSLPLIHKQFQEMASLINDAREESRNNFALYLRTKLDVDFFIEIYKQARSDLASVQLRNIYRRSRIVMRELMVLYLTEKKNFGVGLAESGKKMRFQNRLRNYHYSKFVLLEDDELVLLKSENFKEFLVENGFVDDLKSVPDFFKVSQNISSGEKKWNLIAHPLGCKPHDYDFATLVPLEQIEIKTVNLIAQLLSESDQDECATILAFLIKTEPLIRSIS